MRVCAVSLPELRVELVRADLACPPGPLAVVVAPEPMTEAKLLGNTRLSVVSREARSLGVQPGQTIAQARARASNLSVRVVRPEAVRDVLARLAEVGLAFGATVSFGMAGDEREKMDFGDVVWVDVTGCAHLHQAPHERGSIFDGETVLASRLAGTIASLGHTCAVAIADGPRVAAMLARTAAEVAARAASTKPKALLLLEPLVVRPGENRAAIAELPLAALPVAPADQRWLAKLGVRSIGELRALPRDGVGARLGPSARDVLALAEGEDRAPLRPYVPPEVPAEETELEYGVEGSQALTFVAKTLCDRLASRLQGRAMAAGRVELVLRLDAALLRDRPAEEATALVALDLPAPLSLAGDLLAALRPKIERLALGAPVLRATLRAPVLVHKRAAALSLFEPQPKAERALPRLVAELVSDLGSEAVARLELGDSWVPEERSRLVPFDAKAPPRKPRRRLLASVPEPTRLLAAPQPVARESVHITRHLARVESLEWWKTTPTIDPSASRSPVDYVQAWTEDGAAWVAIDRRNGAMTIRGWFD